MKCIQVRENLEAFADDEIGFAERENIASHLANCESCSSEFEGLKSIGKAMKNTLPVSASASLDAKVFEAFENHNAGATAIAAEEKQEKIGWFGIPKLAFAVALLLLAMFSGFAFQLGRMSVGNAQENIAEKDKKAIDVTKSKSSEFVATNKDDSKEKEQQVVTKIVEVPVVKEKIVKVPVVKEKIITRTIYVDRNRKVNKPSLSGKDNLALNNSVKDGEFLTVTNLKDFQPVSKIKPKIIKEE